MFIKVRRGDVLKRSGKDVHMNVIIEQKNDVVTAKLQGEIDHHTAAGMRQAIDAVIERGSPSLLVLDFKAVTFTDSSGLALILGRYKLMKAIGGNVELCELSPSVRKIINLGGLERLVTIA